MTFYNKKLVDAAAKSKIMTMLKHYKSTQVTAHLGDVLCVLLEDHPSQDLLASELIQIANGYPDGRFVSIGFNILLAEKANLETSCERWPNGTKEVTIPEFRELISAELKTLPYPVKINTWAAISEEWLQVCNIAWSEFSLPRDKNESLIDDPIPSSEGVEGLIRYHLKLDATYLWFY